MTEHTDTHTDRQTDRPSFWKMLAAGSKNRAISITLERGDRPRHCYPVIS